MTQVAQPQVARPQVAGLQSERLQSERLRSERLRDEQLRLQATERELVREFGAALGEDRVRADVQAVAHHYDDAPVRTFLAVLVEREARARLRGLSAGPST